MEEGRFGSLDDFRVSRPGSRNCAGAAAGDSGSELSGTEAAGERAAHHCETRAGAQGHLPNPPEPDDLRSTLTALTERIDAMVSAPSGPHPGWSSQQFGISTPPGLLGVPAKVPPTAAHDRARDLVGGATLPLIAGPPSAKAKSTVLPKLSEPAPANRQDLSTTLNRIATALEKDRGKSSFEAGYGTNVYAAQSEEEYTGMIADSCGSGVNLGGRALLEKVKKPEKCIPPSSSRHTSPSRRRT